MEEHHIMALEANWNYKEMYKLKNAVNAECLDKKNCFSIAGIDIGKRIVIYGAGYYGKRLYSIIKKNKTYKIEGIIDQKTDIVFEIPVKSIKDLAKIQYDYIVIAIKDIEVMRKVKTLLINDGVDKDSIVWATCP